MNRLLMAVLLLPATASSQNAGIGIVPTKGKLEVSGAVGNTVAIFGTDGAGISFQQNWPTVGFNEYYSAGPKSMATGSGWLQYLDMNTGSLAFDHAPTVGGPNAGFSQVRRVTIRQNGNVSINATEANASLFVGGANLGFPAAVFRGTSYPSYFFEQSGVGNTGRGTYINGGKPGSLVRLNEKLGGNIIIGNGSSKVGINTSTPTDVLEVKQVNGRGLALINTSFGYWEFFVEKNLVENAGDMYVYRNGANLGNFYNGDSKYYFYSDRRVKTNITTLNAVLDGALALKPCTYEISYDNPGHFRSIGLIAQEARMVFPEITGHVEGDDFGFGGLKDLYTMDYAALGPIAIKAIQEQQVKVDKLKTQVATLKQRVAAAERLLKINNIQSPNQ